MSDIVKRLKTFIAPENWEADLLIFDATKEIERLQAENASLASWQCEFTDGKTGLVNSEGGGTYCAMARKVERLLSVKPASRQLDIEVESLKARVKQPEAALEPFAKAARCYDDDVRGGNMPSTGVWHGWRMGNDVSVDLTVEHLREARDVLVKA